VGSLFQKDPGQSSASGLGSQLQPIISQIEQYTGNQQQAERGAVAGLGENPYFEASQAYNPSAYRVNPNQTETFGATGPGTYLANLSSIQAGPKPEPWDPTKGELPKGNQGAPPGPKNPGKPPIPPVGGRGPVEPPPSGPVGHNPA
jgi:hypothetical protein